MQVIYTDKRGAGCVRTFGDADACIAFLKTLKAEAVVYNDAREVIGKVERDEAGICDDRRVKWLWWFER